MQQQDSKYCTIPLEKMLEQSAPRMLAWATRWKIGIYQSIRRAKFLSKWMTVPLRKIWDPDRIDEPKKKLDKRRVTQLKQKKYKATKITIKMKVKKQWTSTSRVPDYIKGKTYLIATFDNLETVVLEKNDKLHGNAFND